MGSAIPPLRTLLIVFRRLLIRIVNPKFIQAALTGLVRRLALWTVFIRSKLYHNRRIDKPSDGNHRNSSLSSNDDDKTTKRDLPYVIVGKGEYVSLSGTALSIYPYSSEGIRNWPVQSRTRRSSDTASFSGSTWALPLNPTPEWPKSQRQRSTSLPEPIDPEHLISSEPMDGTTSIPIPASASNSQNGNHGITPDSISFGRPLLKNPEIQQHFIKAVLPEDTRRYKRRTKIAQKWCYYQLEPMTTVFHSEQTPPGWVRLVHPEGARYFYHEDKNIYTDSDLPDPRLYERLMNDVFRLERLINTFDKPFPKGASLMIDVSYEDDNPDLLQTEYYYADHGERVIFFLHPSNTDDMSCTYKVNGPKSYSHLGFVMQSQYWMFVSLYPTCLILTDELLCDLRDIVLYLIGDLMTSPYSIAPYTMDTMFQILSLIDGMEKNVGRRTAGTMSLFARHMQIFYYSKYINCHGETFSRIERHVSIYGNPIDKRTWLIKTLSFVLFSAPDVHLRNLQKVWVDQTLHKPVWENLTKKLSEEWQEFIFFATVMLTSNVGYLAIQSVDINLGVARSPGQIASYFSVVANIGSILLGLLLVHQNRTKMTESADGVQHFLIRRHHLLGLETLAILYSLPYALLMWGVVAFCIAFCCLFFQNSTTESRAWIGSLSVIVTILIVWCIVTYWGTHWQSKEQAPDRPLVQVESQVDDISDHDVQNGFWEILDIIRHIQDLIRHIPDLVRDLAIFEQSTV